MIKTLLFDFGDVFINLDKEAPGIEMKKLGIHSFSDKMIEINKQYETGKMDTTQFLEWYQKEFPWISKKQLSKAWNSIILSFPEYKLKFLEDLVNSKQYQLILLSNTNDLHIEKVIENMTLKRYNRFKNCFNAFYLSQEINLRKPDKNIYEFIFKTHNIDPHECFFIDDTLENIIAAKKLGIQVWNISPKKEDIVDLFKINTHLIA